MLRSFVCGVFALVLAANVSLAADKKAAKDKTVTGAFVSAKDGTLTLKLKGKKGEEPKSQEFKIADDTKAIVFVGDEKKESTVKDALKDLKEGTNVTVTLGEGDKVTGVQVGAAKKKPGPKTVSGTFVSSKDGTLTLKIKGKKGEEPKAQEFKVAGDAKATVFAGDEKKEGTAKDAFKDVKEGTAVALTLGEGDKVAAVTVGKAKKTK